MSDADVEVAGNEVAAPPPGAADSGQETAADALLLGADTGRKPGAPAPGGEASTEKPAADGASAPPPVPEKYELSIPEGMRFQPGQMQAFEAQARELGLSGEQAQKLLETAHANQTEAARQRDAQIRQWAEDSRNDPEIGGSRFEENVGIANAALKRFDPDGRIAKMLNETGYGNHPDVVRIFARIGRSVAEDQPPAGGSGKQAPDIPLPDRLYPNWNVKR